MIPGKREGLITRNSYCYHHLVSPFWKLFGILCEFTSSSPLYTQYIYTRRYLQECSQYSCYKRTVNATHSVSRRIRSSVEWSLQMAHSTEEQWATASCSVRMNLRNSLGEKECGTIVIKLKYKQAVSFKSWLNTGKLKGRSMVSTSLRSYLRVRR